MLGGTFMHGKFTAAATPPAKIIYIKGSGRDSEASQQIDLVGQEDGGRQQQQKRPLDPRGSPGLRFVFVFRAEPSAISNCVWVGNKKNKTPGGLHNHLFSRF